MLVLEVEYLRGVAVAALPWVRDRAEWPPHPDRLFSALVAAWAERGKDAHERAALEWLERQPAPAVHASDAPARDVRDHFVPPNDMTVSGRAGQRMPSAKSLQTSLAVLPALRSNRQPRRFPTVVPDDPRVAFVWPDAPPPEVRGALAALAGELTSLGHSSSVVRGGLRDAPPETEHHRVWTPAADGAAGLRVPYEGRFAELENGYLAGAHADPPFRPLAAEPTSYRAPEDVRRPDPPASPMGRDWWVFADDGGGLVPDLVAFPAVAARLREALMAAAPQPVAEVLSGHDAQGRPSAHPHLAIVPLADVGWPHAGGRLMGLALVRPRAAEVPGSPARAAVRDAVAALLSASGGGHGVKVKLGAKGVWNLAREPVSERRSLRPDRYLRTARRWATVTPLVLDRHPKAKPGRGAADVVARGCAAQGLPAPRRVTVHDQPAVTGAPSRHEMRLPPDGKLGTRPLRHAVVEFDEPVTGPLLLGAGRFKGLGLCLPLDGDRS